MPASTPITVKRVELFYFRADIKEPIRTSFAIIPARTVVLIRIEDADGGCGWGELWSNFPPCGSENKFRLLETLIVPMVLGRSYDRPPQAWIDLTSRTRRNAIQSGEPGNFASCIAGIDIALWDLHARRAGVPLWQALGGIDRPAPLPAYASNLNPDGAPEYVAACREKGYRAYKMKVGFGMDTDLDNVRRICADLRDGERFMIDANQGWDLVSARPAIETFGHYPLDWIEEPICVDDPAAHWAEVAMLSRVPLAGGENMIRFDSFDAAIAAGHLDVIQPDVGKWGGITGCHAVARRAVAAGMRYCPHWLNSGIGLLAGAHILAAAGGEGLLEHDALENPFQAVLAQPFPELVDGCFPLPDGPGLGAAPDLPAVKDHLVMHREFTD